MRGLGIVLVAVAFLLGTSGMSSPTNKGAFLGGAALLLAVGIVLLSYSTYLASKRGDFMTRMAQMNEGSVGMMGGQATGMNIEKLMKLRDSGVISDEQFEEQKKRLT